MVLLTGLLWATPATAEQSPVMVDTEETKCSEQLVDAFAEELRLRSSARVISQRERSEGERTRSLVVETVDDDTCQVRLEGAENSLPIARDADTVEIASVATRVAWIIDGEDISAQESNADELNFDSGEQLERLRRVTEQMGGMIGAQVVDAAGGMSPDQPPPAAPQADLGVVAGPMWLPSMSTAVGLLRVRAGWQPWENVRFGLVGRLPTGALEAHAGGYDYRYRPWAIDLTAGYLHDMGRNWSVGLDGGVRVGMPVLSVSETTTAVENDDAAERAPTQTPDIGPGSDAAETESPVNHAPMSVAFAANTAVSYAVFAPLAVRLDTGVAVSVTDRRIADDSREVMDPGFVELELLLGLELRL